MYCNVYNYVALSHCSKLVDEGRGGGGINQWIHVQIYSYNASIITLNRWQKGREEGRKGGRESERARGQQTIHDIEKIHPFEFEHLLLWNQCYVTLLEKDREMETRECVCACARTGMDSVSAEPNVRPIKVYWDQVVLVSLTVEAELFLTKHGAEYDGTGGNGGGLEWPGLAPPPTPDRWWRWWHRCAMGAWLL